MAVGVSISCEVDPGGRGGGGSSGRGGRAGGSGQEAGGGGHQRRERRQPGGHDAPAAQHLATLELDNCWTKETYLKYEAGGF